MIKEDLKTIATGTAIVVTGAVIVDLWRLGLGTYLKKRQEEKNLEDKLRAYENH